MHPIAPIRGILRFSKALAAALLIILFSHQAGAEKLTPIPELLAVVNGPANKVHISERYTAVQAIGMHGTTEAAAVLIDLLKGDTKFMAALSLLQIRERQAVPLLAAHLDDQDSFTRLCLCETIGALGGDAAVATLVEVARHDAAILVRRIAVYALRTDADARPEGSAVTALLELMEIQELTRDVFDVFIELENPKTFTRLSAALQSENPQIRAFTCEVIKNRRNAESTDPLLALLKNEQNEVVLGQAIVALAAVHPPERTNEVAKVLTKFLKSDSLCEITISALGSTVSHADSLDARLSTTLGKLLLPILESPNNAMRHTAVNIYKELRFSPASPNLMQLIRREEDDYIRANALAALAVSLQNKNQVDFIFDWRRQHPDDDRMVSEAVALLDTPAATPRLIAELKAEDPSFIYTVIPALARTRDNAAAQPLLERIAARKEPCEKAALALMHVAAEKDLARLAALLKEEPCAKTQLGRTLVHLDRLNGFNQIRNYLRSGQKEDLAALFIVLDRWHTLPTDAAILTEVLAVKDPSLRGMSIQALGRIDAPKVTDLICKSFGSDPDDFVRESAARALGNIGSAAGITCLSDGYMATSKDPNRINLNEATLRSLRTATGQQMDTAEQWQAWVQEGMGLGRGIEGCIDALASDNEAVRRLAARQIAAWPESKEKRTAKAAILKQLATGSGSYEEMLSYAQTLAGDNDPSALAIMQTVCEQTTELRVRTAFARALYQSGNNWGVARLLQCLDDELDKDREYEMFEIMEALALATDRPLNYDADQWKQWWRKHSPHGEIAENRRRGRLDYRRTP